MTLPLSEGDVAAFRSRLTDIATALYVRDGLDALSMRSLAKAAGVSRSTPYNYFASKLDIVDSVRAAAFDRLTERCREALARNTDVLQQMRALGWELVRFALDEPDVYRLMFGRPVFSEDVAPQLRDAISRFREVSRPPLQQALAAGLVDGDADTLRRTTWAAFHGLITLYLHGHFESTEQLAADFEALNHIIGFGILVRPEPTEASS